MTLFIKVPLQEAEKIKQILLTNDLLNTSHKYIKQDDVIFFPVSEQTKENQELSEYEFSEIEQEELFHTKAQSLKEIFANTLTEKEKEHVKSSYDTVGTIAILEIDNELKEKEQKLGQLLLDNNKSIKTVVAKNSIHQGEFRTQDHRHLAGEQTFSTIHKENNCKLYVDINETYFSARLATERKRIAKQVMPSEEILVMFSGAAPYPCVLSKLTLAKKIIGVEKNPQAHIMAQKNVKLNKLTNIELYNEDVRTIVPKLGTFDRVIMPLPKSAEDFLELGINATTKGGTLHFYDFIHEELFEESKRKILKKCTQLGRQADFRGMVRCGQQSPRVYRICVDVVID